MRPLEELINLDEPGIEVVRGWVNQASVPCVLLEPSADADTALLNLQVSTRSPLGAVAHGTGGVVVQSGWLRFLGSGHPRLTRRIDLWNESRAAGHLLVADDAVGGLFALNGGALGPDLGNAYYLGPDSLEWVALEIGYSDLIRSMLSPAIDEFYKDLRWPGWETDVAALPCDDAFVFYPFLWASQGSPATSARSTAPMKEVFAFTMEAMAQLHQGGA